MAEYNYNGSIGTAPGLNDSKDLELAEKKRKRLERNRESARECRKRKKEKKLLLRQQLNLLEADNLQLRLKLQVGREKSPGSGDKGSYITSKLDSMIKEGASEADISKMISELQERHSDYGRDRRSAIDFHVEQLRRCLLPTQTTRAVLWLMSLAPQFHNKETGEIQYQYHKDAETAELFNLWLDLLSEVKPTPQQKKLMISYTTPSTGTSAPSSSSTTSTAAAQNTTNGAYASTSSSSSTSGDNGKSQQQQQQQSQSINTGADPFADIKSVTDTCNRMLDRLVAIIGNKNESLDSEMQQIQTILSATQIAKFILWIDNNPACMQMLEALWPHITQSEHHHPQQQQQQSPAGAAMNANSANTARGSSNSGSSSSNRRHHGGQREEEGDPADEEEEDEDIDDDEEDDDDDSSTS